MNTTPTTNAPAQSNVNAAPKPAAPAPAAPTPTPAPAATTPTPAAGDNDKRFKELVSQASKFGGEAALGADALPKLAHAVVQAAGNGVISLSTKHKLKDGKEGDVATYLYEKYASEEGKKALHEHSKAGIKGNASKLRQLISLGLMTTVDGVDVMNNAYTARDNMLHEDGVKVKAAYPFYVEVAREQLKSDKPLTMKALEGLAVKDEPDDKTLEQEVKAIIGRLEGLVTGENKFKLKDTSGKCEEAMHKLKELFAKMILDKQRMELIQAAAKLGLNVA